MQLKKTKGKKGGGENEGLVRKMLWKASLHLMKQTYY